MASPPQPATKVDPSAKADPTANVEPAPKDEPQAKADTAAVPQTESRDPPRLITPDPLPLLNRPIFQAPQPVRTHTAHLHPNTPHPAVEGAIEELRTRLGEMREFLKRFPHEVGGELGELVTHLRAALGVPKVDPQRQHMREQEDAARAARRRAEDLIAPPTERVLHRRAEEDAGLAVSRRVQDI